MALWGTTEDEKRRLGPLASGRRDWPAGRRRSQCPNAFTLFSNQTRRTQRSSCSLASEPNKIILCDLCVSAVGP